jgi:polysaccharide export outer membrane protein
VRVFHVLLASALMLSPACWSQEAAPPSLAHTGLAPGDQLEVHMYDFPELGGVIHAHIDADGTIHLPYAGTVDARGKSPEELQIAIGDALKTKGIVKDPNVTVEIVSAVNMTVQVMGEVRQPRAIPVFAPMPVSYVLSQVGGTSGLASHKVTILHNGDESPTTIEYDANTPSMAALSTVVRPGDVVSVSSRGVFFVAGEVNRPGIFPIGGVLAGGAGTPAASPVETMTLLGALAQAGGLTNIAARSQMRILRTQDGKREEIKVDQVKLYKGEVADPIVMPNDIIYIPSSYIRLATNNIFGTAVSGILAAVQLKQF